MFLVSRSIFIIFPQVGVFLKFCSFLHMGLFLQFFSSTVGLFFLFFSWVGQFYSFLQLGLFLTFYLSAADTGAQRASVPAPVRRVSDRQQFPRRHDSHLGLSQRRPPHPRRFGRIGGALPLSLLHFRRKIAPPHSPPPTPRLSEQRIRVFINLR